MTAASSLLPDVPLRVFLDVRHPMAWLALGPTIELVHELAVETDWVPLPVAPLKPPGEPPPDDDRGARHRRFRARAIAREIETYARARGLPLRDYHRPGDAAAANLGWLWLRERFRERLVPYLAALFEGYWTERVDASRLDDVARLVASSDADRKAFVAWSHGEGPKRAAAIDAAARSLGAHQVPAYMVAGDLFFGRQHVPMVRWILQDRTGPAPV